MLKNCFDPHKNSTVCSAFNSPWKMMPSARRHIRHVRRKGAKIREARNLTNSKFLYTYILFIYIFFSCCNPNNNQTNTDTNRSKVHSKQTVTILEFCSQFLSGDKPIAYCL